MKVQYRIANRSGDYYPQVRTKKFLFWSSWKKIAKHPTGYGMYGLPNTNYPKTKMECEEIITDFDKWFKNENTVNESYSNFYLVLGTVKKALTHNRCDSCGFTKDEVYLTEHFAEAGFIECMKCYNTPAKTKER